MKKIINFLLLICFVLTITIPVSAKTQVVAPNVYLEESKLDFENDVINVDGSTYFPMLELLHNFNVSDENILWDPEIRAVTIFANNSITMFVIDSAEIIENGSPLAVTTPPIIYNDSTYLPIRLVARACGYDVHYNEITKNITITKQ